MLTIFASFRYLFQTATATSSGGRWLPPGECVTNTKNETEKNPIENCPFCGSADLEKFDELKEGIGADELTEQELADYKAGKWGTLICKKCGMSIGFHS